MSVDPDDGEGACYSAPFVTALRRAIARSKAERARRGPIKVSLCRFCGGLHAADCEPTTPHPDDQREQERPMIETPTWPGAVWRRTGSEQPWHAYEIETEAGAPLASVHVLDERVAAQLAALLRGEQAAEVEWLRKVLEAERDEHRVADARGVAPDALRALSRWIDEHPGNAERDPEARSWGRLAKIQEEAGEVVAAFIGWTGQNPRKGQPPRQSFLRRRPANGTPQPNDTP